MQPTPAPRGRRVDDVAGMVRGWADAGAVDARVAARFLRDRTADGVRRRAAWLASGAAMRRRDD